MGLRPIEGAENRLSSHPPVILSDRIPALSEVEGEQEGSRKPALSGDCEAIVVEWGSAVVPRLTDFRESEDCEAIVVEWTCFLISSAENPRLCGQCACPHFS